MKDKYYTPEIEEFHVGFEFEEWINGSWGTDIFEPDVYCDDRDIYVRGVDKDTIRVKYLDKEDIESLGFELKAIPLGEDTNEDELGIFRKDTGAFEGTFFLDRTLHNCNIEFFNCYFMVKNKSEFKRVLKMLNIKPKENERIR